MKQRGLADNYVILEVLEKDLLAFRVISLKSVVLEPAVNDYRLGDGLKIRLVSFPEPPSIDQFLENGGTNDSIHSFRSHLDGAGNGRKFLMAVRWYLKLGPEFEPERFKEAIYSEAGVLKLFNVELIFSPAQQGLGEHLYETEKRILNYFKK